MSTTTQIKPRVNRKLAVEIARDVLKQLRAKRYIAHNGTYCQVENLPFEVSPTSSFREAFKKEKEIQCNVCALGSLFTSFVNLRNVFSVRQVNKPKFRNMIPALRKSFDVRDLLLMEYAFEQGCVGILVNAKNRKYGWGMAPDEVVIGFRGRHVFTDSELNRVSNYGAQYPDSDQRLRLIMLNVIRNKGRFVVPQE